MKIRQDNFTFLTKKNHNIIQERCISFEEIIAAIESECLFDVFEHPNTEKYPHQRV